MTSTILFMYTISVDVDELIKEKNLPRLKWDDTPEKFFYINL